MEKIDLKNLSLPELTTWVIALGLKPFRAEQIFSWIQRPDFTDFASMTNIAKHVRSLLAEKAVFSRMVPAKVECSEDGAVKFALRLEDGKMIESVLIPEDGRNTLCVSSQVGCAMDCKFCLTGTMGLARNLTAAEIVGQVDVVRNWLFDQAAEGPRINNLVFMGMGEPLLNFTNLIRAVEILMEQRGYDFSGRRITVSTCGIVPKIKELGEKVPVNLAISLHAPDDETRNKLMPINRTYPLAELLRACREYPLPPRRRIMIEYVMIKDVNDSALQAHLLVRRLHGIRCKINILPYNENSRVNFRRPDDQTIEAFRQVLRRAGYTTLLRSSRGTDISAACGQLAA